MALVDYSDSEGSDNEQDAPPSKIPPAKPNANPNDKFSIDKTAPNKIRVNLNTVTPTNESHEDEPAAKRPRISGGGFSGFNAMLPPPKRDAEKAQAQAQGTAKKAPARKVFSLKTGAEPGFSRESDAEMRQLFAEQDTTGRGGEDDEIGIPNVPKKEPSSLPKPIFADEKPKGNAFMFKPLSVARGTKGKKKANGVAKAPVAALEIPTATTETNPDAGASLPAPKKVSLFSSGDVVEQSQPTPDEPDPEPDVAYDEGVYENIAHDSIPAIDTAQGSQSLDAIASDLQLSAADRRQLFGRGGKASSAAALNVMNFNTDQEYAANQEAIANGEQIQHNPVRSIAPGKHSLRQLIGAAQGQKDALEESFATGKRNKKEAGNKYGW